MRILRLTSLFMVLVCGEVSADINVESRPWVKSFLETTSSFSLEKVSPHFRQKKNRFRRVASQGIVHVSTSPQPDWQVDGIVATGSRSSGKISARAERLLFSDLQDRFFALSCFVGVSKSQEGRAKNPAFFEMARETCEAGVGIGKHLYVGESAYTQAFSYVILGLGRRARWMQVELGGFHLFCDKKSVRCSFSHVEAFPHARAFNGYGTIRTHVNAISLQYNYELQGVEVFLQLSKRWAGKGLLRSAEIYKLGISWPFSF